MMKRHLFLNKYLKMGKYNLAVLYQVQQGYPDQDPWLSSLFHIIYTHQVTRPLRLMVIVMTHLSMMLRVIIYL